MNKFINFAYDCKKKHMKRLFFIDAYALIYRAYFAFIKKYLSHKKVYRFQWKKQNIQHKIQQRGMI